MKIRLAGIIPESIVDGPGLRYTLFTQGCPHKCYQCHNPETHNISGGYLKDIDSIIRQIISHPYIDGVTISGGEPFLQVDALLSFLTKLKDSFTKKIIVYTGYTFEELLNSKNPRIKLLLTEIDYLIDGPFDYTKRDLTLPYRGSTNQRIIDVKKSLEENCVIQTSL
ncbi:MAG: anaerobic ribonucleoside-triphosphate reductase activating protein [Bacilli bacterium]|nr:anaerobic ribonucleoside-triphosphate reductase activating protein [Bacilli bacterium]